MNIFIHIQQLYVVISHIHKFRFNDIFLSYEYIYLHSRHIIFIHFQGQIFYSTRLQYVIQHFVRIFFYAHHWIPGSYPLHLLETSDIIFFLATKGNNKADEERPNKREDK